jgi:hypothetical protein
MRKNSNLTAETLKGALWDTLNEIRSGTRQANEGDAIASQAREILRTVKVQLQIAHQGKRVLPKEVIAFSENTTS